MTESARFADLNAKGRLLPSKDDRLRDRAEAVIRLQRALTAGLLQHIDHEASLNRNEATRDPPFGALLPIRGWPSVPHRIGCYGGLGETVRRVLSQEDWPQVNTMICKKAQR